MKETDSVSRRKFISSTALASAAASFPYVARGEALQSDTIRVAAIGLGGRGTGAIGQILDAPKDLEKDKNIRCNTKLVAVADAFPEKATNKIAAFKKKYGDDRVDVEGRIFGGIDGYKQAINEDVDMVVIATPPGFKPQQFEYAINQGKKVFMEKPVASDVTGVRRVLEAAKKAKEKGLTVGIGLQRRHEERFTSCVKQLQDGVIGDINMLRVYWNGNSIWHRAKQEGMTEMEYQVNNWYHFTWASGDQICEQHIHNLDVGCWIKGMYPIKANGMGGSEMRMGGDRSLSQIFDHTFVEYTFPDGTKMFSQGRHLKGGWSHVAEYAHGSKGTCAVAKFIEPFDSDPIRIGRSPGGHYQEQKDLIEALHKGEYYNEAEYGAMSTFTAILGREACYSGKEIEADDLLKNGREYAPGIDHYTWDTTPPVVPGENGEYPVPAPGVYRPFA
ncbi:MAG: Gfo/Idh/MocA family protein [Opitutales bacterium]|jgi:myo-inositol 2-dehydrogenase/D-chiro-inositol 1-dehydrogenase